MGDLKLDIKLQKYWRSASSQKCLIILTPEENVIKLLVSYNCYDATRKIPKMLNIQIICFDGFSNKRKK